MPSPNRPEPRIRDARSLALVLLTVAATTLLRLALNPLLARKAALIVYFPALVLSAWIGGWAGGLLALTLSALVATYLFLSPDHRFSAVGRGDQVTLLVFIIVGISVSALSDAQRRASRRALAAAEDAERRRQALQESEARHQRLLETANEGVLTLDAADRITYVNTRLTEMLGAARGDLIGRPVDDLLSPEGGGGTRRGGWWSAQGQCELRLRRADGADVWAMANVSTLWEGEQYAGSFSLLTDITERREAERGLKAAYEREALVNRIGQSVRSASDPQAILTAAAAALGETLAADRCYYVTYEQAADVGRIVADWHRAGLASVAGMYRMSEHGLDRQAQFLSAGTHVVEDVLADPDAPGARAVAPGLRALVRAPLQQGAVMTALVVAMADQARHWRRDEVGLVETVAAQTKAAVEAAQATGRERGFLRDVLASVTGGRLLLCGTAADLPAPLPPVGEPVLLTREGGLRDLRLLTLDASAGMTEERRHDLVTAASEAAMNAVTHGGGGGTGRVGAGADGTVQVWVEDRGTGIALESLPKATLARGFSTKASLGHGFKMMQEVDRVYVLTGPAGTTVVMEQGREQAAPLGFKLAAS